MRYFLTVVVVCACGLQCGARPALSDSICILTGDIRGFGDHRIIFFYSTDTGTHHFDTVMTSGGRFVYTTHLREPALFTIYSIKDNVPAGKKQVSNKRFKRYRVIKLALLEDRQMYLNTRVDSFYMSRIGDAPMNDTLMSIQKISDDVFDQDIAWRKWHRHTFKPDSNHLSARNAYRRDSLSRIMDQRIEDSLSVYIRAHPASYASAYSLRLITRSDSVTRASLYNALDPALRHLPAVVGFKKRIDKVNTHLAKGDMAPDISLADTSGRIITLSSFRGKGLILVDFWASWCGPCRKENPNVIAAYKKFHKKGFEIYSVSLDEKKTAWIAAINKDKLDWTHVSDLLGWDAKYAKVYGVAGIPANFLLDKDGRIVAKNLRGKELGAMLSGLLK